MAKTKKSKSKSGGLDQWQQFLIWHGEKIALPVFVVLALWFALMGLGYQGVPWKPNELVDSANRVETSIRGSNRSATDEGIAVFDYAVYAKQIKEQVPVDPYRTNTVWNPTLTPNSATK